MAVGFEPTTSPFVEDNRRFWGSSGIFWRANVRVTIGLQRW